MHAWSTAFKSRRLITNNIFLELLLGPLPGQGVLQSGFPRRRGLVLQAAIISGTFTSTHASAVTTAGQQSS